MANDLAMRAFQALRILYRAVALVLLVLILLLPSKQISPANVRALDIMYPMLLVVALAELGLMVYLHSHAIRGKLTVRSAPGALPQQNSPGTGLVLLYSLAISQGVYGVVFRVLGGTVSRSVALWMVSLLSIVLVEIWVPRYVELARGNAKNDGGQS